MKNTNKKSEESRLWFTTVPNPKANFEELKDLSEEEICQKVIDK